MSFGHRWRAGGPEGNDVYCARCGIEAWDITRDPTALCAAADPDDPDDLVDPEEWGERYERRVINDDI